MCHLYLNFKKNKRNTQDDFGHSGVYPMGLRLNSEPELLSHHIVNMVTHALVAPAWGDTEVGALEIGNTKIRERKQQTSN